MTTTVQTATGRVYPELTWTAISVGWILGVIIAISIGYAALILGFSIEGSELAAILGFGILRGALRRKSIIENNIVQMIASGGLPMRVRAWCICSVCRYMRTS